MGFYLDGIRMRRIRRNPQTNLDYWKEKLKKNKERDGRDIKTLEAFHYRCEKYSYSARLSPEPTQSSELILVRVPSSQYVVISDDNIPEELNQRFYKTVPAFLFSASAFLAIA